jgi:hypothetical protein
LVGITLYFFCDWALVMLEKVHGTPLPHRNIIFLVLILMLSVSSFSLIRNLFEAEQSAQHNDQEQQPADR